MVEWCLMMFNGLLYGIYLLVSSNMAGWNPRSEWRLLARKITVLTCFNQKHFLMKHWGGAVWCCKFSLNPMFWWFDATKPKARYLVGIWSSKVGKSVVYMYSGYIHTCIHIYIYIHIYWFIYLSIYVYTYIYIYLYIAIYDCLCA